MALSVDASGPVTLFHLQQWDRAPGQPSLILISEQGFVPYRTFLAISSSEIRQSEFSLFCLTMAGQLAQLDPAELSKLPSVAPPPGVTIDFDGPNPLEATSVTVTTVFVGLAFLFVGIRAYTKIKIKGSWSWDDCKLHAYIT